MDDQERLEHIKEFYKSYPSKVVKQDIMWLVEHVEGDDMTFKNDDDNKNSLYESKLKERLSEVARKKREELIKEFYESKKNCCEKSAEQGFTGYCVRFEEMEKELKMALMVEEDRLSEIITEIDVRLVRAKILLTEKEVITKICFNWG